MEQRTRLALALIAALAALRISERLLAAPDVTMRILPSVRLLEPIGQSAPLDDHVPSVSEPVHPGMTDSHMLTTRLLHTQPLQADESAAIWKQGIGSHSATDGEDFAKKILAGSLLASEREGGDRAGIMTEGSKMSDAGGKSHK